MLSLPGSVLWATIFFVMLLVLGIDSEFCNVEALVTGMVDNWPDTLLKHRRLFTICLSAFLFCLGVPLVTNVTKCPQYPGDCVLTLPSSGRYLRFPADGLLLLLRHGAALGLLLPNHRHRMGVWGREVIATLVDWWQTVML